jgi:hypothetical protein
MDPGVARTQRLPHTLLYADYAPDLSQAALWAARAFDNAANDDFAAINDVGDGKDGREPREIRDERLREAPSATSGRSTSASAASDS